MTSKTEFEEHFAGIIQSNGLKLHFYIISRMCFGNLMIHCSVAETSRCSILACASYRKTRMTPMLPYVVPKPESRRA